MARSDLLVTLVRASASGDRKAVRSTVEAIIAEERSLQHNGVADRLTEALGTSVNGTNFASPPGTAAPLMRGRDYLAELNPRRKLTDLVLPPDCRSNVEELIEEQHRADILRSYGVEPRNRILLVGAPGNGKTALAEAIAEALNVGFFIVRYEYLIGSYLGETASRLRRVIDYARTTPCVLFFDEFDAIGKERGDTHETGEIKRVVSTLLMQIDDLPTYTVLIAATNHPELLDRAVWRRFQLRLDLPKPGPKDICEYITRFAKQLKEPLGHKAETIAKRLNFASYSEVEQFCIDVRRRQILAQGAHSLKDIVSARIKHWSRRVGNPEQIEKS